MLFYLRRFEGIEIGYREYKRGKQANFTHFLKDIAPYLTVKNVQKMNSAFENFLTKKGMSLDSAKSIWSGYTIEQKDQVLEILTKIEMEYHSTEEWEEIKNKMRQTFKKFLNSDPIANQIGNLVEDYIVKNPQEIEELIRQHLDLDIEQLKLLPFDYDENLRDQLNKWAREFHLKTPDFICLFKKLNDSRISILAIDAKCSFKNVHVKQIRAEELWKTFQFLLKRKAGYSKLVDVFKKVIIKKTK